MNTETQLAERPPTQLAEPPRRSTGDLLAAVIQGGVTPENVASLKELCALKEREDARDAHREFARDFTALQIETPKIQAQKGVPDKFGNLKYKFAPYEDIMRAVRPLLAKHGFAVTYDQDVKDGRVIVTCTLMHRSGHSQANKFACRIGSGPPGSSEAQGDGAATTYAKRFAICAALGITIETDTDGGKNEGDGEEVKKEQAAELKLACEETGSNQAKFLEWLGAPDFESILSKDYARAAAMLKRKAAR